jgi:hypothetical protein
VKKPAVVVLALALALAACSSSDNGEAAAPSTNDTPAAAATLGSFPPAPEGIPGVVQVPVSGANHVNGTVQYPTSPPAGGNHNPVWQNCGFYSKPVTNELAVHSLEHGAVWITYEPDADRATTDALRALAKSNNYLLVTPYASNPAPVVLTAWARQLRVDSATDPRVGQFIDKYIKDGPTTREPGAACSGAVGSPPDQPNSLVR